MLVWHEHYPVGRGWRSGWVLSYDTNGKGSPDDYIVGLGLPDVDAAVAQAREYLRSVGYRAAGWPSSSPQQAGSAPRSASKAAATMCTGRCGTLSHTAQRVVPAAGRSPRHAFMIT